MNIMTNKPIISVIMSVYNDEKYVKLAVNSILKQTFTDFEFIIVDDKSTDASLRIVGKFTDRRIKILHNKQRLFLGASLNKAIKNSKGKYLVRMDTDDISDQNRILQLYEFMENNPDIDVCGTWLKTFGKMSEKWRFPLKNEEIKVRLLFNNVLAHPSVIIRKESLIKYNLFYDPKFYKLQDFDLWSRAIPYLNFANLNKYLLNYRVKTDYTNRIDRCVSYGIWKKIVAYQLKELGLITNTQILNIHTALSNEDIRSFRKKNVINWLVKIYRAN